MFYGRKEELAFLRSKYESKEAQLIVLYGRRRVGKTELLRYFCKEKPHVFYVCRECIDSEQLRLFSKKILDGSALASYVNTFDDWEDAFTFIKDIPMIGKKLVVIDEYPYMVNANRSISSILQNLWDEILKNEDVMIILCGSSMSFIEKEILGEKNPLYGRTTGIYKLLAFDFFTSMNFFKNAPMAERILNYAVLGGTPHYLKQFDPALSTEDNIRSNILTKGCVLYNEVEFLMKQELRETATYYSIIEAIALGSTKLNDIYTKTLLDKSKINVYLKNLINLNIVERQYPVTEGIKKVANAQGGLYRIKDNYFKFYFRFIFPHLSELEAGDAEGVYHYNVKPYLNEYASFAFEDICIQYMRKQNKSLKLPFRFSKIGRWWNKQAEVDIMAFDEKGNILLGECKWRNSKVSIKALNSLKEKAMLLKKEYENKYFYLFSKSGFDEELIKLSQADRMIRLVKLDDLCFLDTKQ